MGKYRSSFKSASLKTSPHYSKSKNNSSRNDNNSNFLPIMAGAIISSSMLNNIFSPQQHGRSYTTTNINKCQHEQDALDKCLNEKGDCKELMEMLDKCNQN